MKQLHFCLRWNRLINIVLLMLFSSIGFAQELYFPDRSEWNTRTPESSGINVDSLNAAIAFAEENEYSGAVDLRRAILKGFEREPYHEILGPTKKRGGPAGMIVKNGYIIAQWGDTKRVDMTFSVTKSYLSTTAGLAYDDGLITDVHEKVGNRIWDGTFGGEHNSKISWHHLLTQSSDWSGTFYGLRDWGDRPPREGGIDDWRLRDLNEPGTVYEYNDVRVNVLAYALLNVWRKPLPMVLKERIMDPIGASTSWRWYGYDNCWVNIDGVKMQSVSGGGHSGGGVFINTEDHARFGLLFLRDGKWNGKQLVSKEWIDKVQVSSEANESYGYMWWLNKGDRMMEGVSPSIYYAAGFGGNYIVVDKENDMVIVTRWLEPRMLGTFLQKVKAAM